MKKIAILVGSLRRDSINLIVARALERLAMSRFEFVYADIGDLPHYNDDLWAEPPHSVMALKQLIESSDGVIFVTPEFNRSIPGLLKNAIDWGSRPWGKNSWSGKPVTVVGASPGAIGTAVAQSHLRSILPILDVALLGQPEVYLQFRREAIDENLDFVEDETRSFLTYFLAQFDHWIEQMGPHAR